MQQRLTIGVRDSTLIRYDSNLVRQLFLHDKVNSNFHHFKKKIFAIKHYFLAWVSGDLKF